jgi:hypothetical protein
MNEESKAKKIRKRKEEEITYLSCIKRHNSLFFIYFLIVNRLKQKFTNSVTYFNITKYTS